MKLNEALNWRYAPKQMTGETVPNEIVEEILEAIRLAPTSAGLQPFEVLVVSKAELKDKIQPIAYNQPQISQSSHLLIFAPWTIYSEERIDNYLENLRNVRELPLESTNDFKNNISLFTQSMSLEQQFHHSSKQAAIAMGFGLVAAALHKVDATPMEGFDRHALDSFLGLRDREVSASTLVALGYRNSEKDFLGNAKKVRKDRDQLFIALN